MSLLTDREIKDIEMYARSVTEWNLQFARAIEAAVIKKLATVSVEPCAWWCCVPGQDVSLLIDEPPDSRYPKGYKDPLYFEEALAAARAQALEALEKTRAFHQQNWSSEEITPKLTRDTIAAIKQHLGEPHGN